MDGPVTLQTIPDHDRWNAWHPHELADRLKRVSLPWCIVGGWALDLWHGRQTREHDDLEFTVLRDDFAAFRGALEGVDFHTAGDGIVKPLALHENPPPEISQIWCLDSVARCWRVDMMLEQGSPDLWVYKREASITRPRRAMVDATPDGLPYLKPAAVLLFKAKHQRGKDEVDFRNALPKLAGADRAWLKSCLARLHPEHDWLRCL